MPNRTFHGMELSLLLTLSASKPKQQVYEGLESVSAAVAKINRMIQSAVRIDAAFMIYGALALALLLLTGP